MKAVIASGQRDAVQSFVDWLFDEAGLWICERGEYETGGEYLFPTFKSRQQLMAAHFGIDLAKIDKEKDAMLRELRRRDAR